MATYTEFDNIVENPIMLAKFRSAIAIAAVNLVQGDPTNAVFRKWLSYVLYYPNEEAQKAFRYTLADNPGFNPGTITSIDDPTIQASVDAIAPHLANAFSGV